MDEKYQVYNKSGRFHLSENGKKTFCGKQISRASGWVQSQGATSKEFIEEVRPRCTSCRVNAEICLFIDDMVKETI